MNPEEDGYPRQNPQAPASPQWPGVGTSPASSNQSREASPAPIPHPPTTTRKGLLSGWKSGDLPYASPAATSLATQNPASSQIGARTTTDPLADYSNIQGFAPNQSMPPSRAGAMPPARQDGMPNQAQQIPFNTYGAAPTAFAPSAPPPSRPYGAPNNTPPWPQAPMPVGPNYPNNQSNTGFPTNGSYAGNTGFPTNSGYAGNSFQQQRYTGNLSPMAVMQRQEPVRTPLPVQKKKRRVPIWARVVLGILIFFLTAGGVGYAYYQTHYAAALTQITGQQAIHQYANKAGDTTTQSNTNANTGDILSGNSINILLLGSDDDGKGNDEVTGTPLTQTDIIVHIDPTAKTVAMISIPRDLQVTDPVTGARPKLDGVFSAGYRGNSVAEKVASGAGRVEDAIQYNYGIHIDHYAWVGLKGFVKVVDTAGGVDVDAIHPIVDDNYPNDVANGQDIYSYKRLYIAPGPQHMNGIQALEYVRSRHADLIGDFGRSARQQQVLAQLKAKLATPEIIGKASDLLNALNGYVMTDLQLGDMVKMATFARSLDMNKINRLTLSPPYASASGTSSNYLPNCALIVPALTKVFGPQAKCLAQVAIPDSNNTNNTNGTTNTPTPTASGQPTPTPGATPSPTPTKKKKNNGGGDILQAFSWPDASQISIFDPTNPSAIRSILDVMFLTTFESLDAVQV